MNTIQEKYYANAVEQAHALAGAVATQLAQAVLSKGKAVLAVSGGRSPVAFFQRLAQIDLPWDKVTVTLVDERIVPPHHADSNARLVREHLLQHQAAAATFRGLLSDDFVADDFTAEVGDSAENLAAAANAIAIMPDVVVLGMGTDGHTASLFPQVADLSATDAVILVRPETAPYARLSLSLQTIIHSPNVFLAIGGAEKIAVYEQAKQRANADLPVSFVLHHNPHVTQVFVHE